MLTPDFDSKLLIDIADRLLQWPDEYEKLQSYLRERAEMVRSGVARCPAWFQQELNLLDYRLRAWWDAWNGQWVIDRLQDEGVVERMVRAARDEGDDEVAESLMKSASGLLANGRYYMTIIQFKPTPTLQLDQQLINMLKNCDMQQADSPSEYIAKKRAAAEKVEKENEHKNSERVLAAVDKMSAKQIEDFLAVEQAIQSGETIIAHGEDAKFLERAKADKLAAQKAAEDAGEVYVSNDSISVLNPGMDPRIYTRKDRQ